jgi:hypothetical protein
MHYADKSEVSHLHRDFYSNPSQSDYICAPIKDSSDEKPLCRSN